MENIAVVLANNQHAIRCVDLRRTDRVEVKNLSLISYGDAIGEKSKVGLSEAPPIPAEGCIGLTMTDGSNYNYSNYTNVFAYGFDEAIQVGGEHVVCINCGAALSTYGFTFGNYEVNCGSNHPITMINCLDERNINLPLFGNACGDSDGKGGRLIGNQEITMISQNFEVLYGDPGKIPGGKLGSYMREVVPGMWKGNIDFTLQPAHCHTNATDAQIWEADGSGMVSKRETTVTRRYAPRKKDSATIQLTVSRCSTPIKTKCSSASTPRAKPGWISSVIRCKCPPCL